MNSTIAKNLENWRESRGLNIRRNEVNRILAQRVANEAAENARRAEEALQAGLASDRIERAKRMGATPPASAIDVKFRRGSDGRGGRTFWEWIFPKQIETVAAY